ncbi:beta-ketoacyl-ACP synthase II [Paracrocinitomix mangrovi]|uniref:beta-ketoacyl-ACP synthase II n=1 Tax=Paracrocinitomix mangrovi TaxID=2862509 RepID=UPI001C8D98F7|nr:beta-ketoacyl-ACP synthase II [Paracrocinitomix mangrovi]UKN01366.1 beta-ketoacyl-ACP synthase II [Paracrocinitomix mangrovi]
MKRVVITGMGALTPIGNNLNDYWNALINGESGAGPITKFDASNFKTQFACEVKGFDPQQYFERNEARKYDIFVQYAVAAADEAIAQAKINFDKLDRNRIGVIWGSGDGGVDTFEDQMQAWYQGDGQPRFNPYFVPKRIINMASGVISIRHGLKGVNYSTSSACSASNTAIIDAFNYIQWGKADMMITGGSEGSVSVTSIGGFNASKALSTRNDDPKTASRPFDQTRDGFVLGEGAGALVLESLDHALARGANIIAEVASGAMAADAYHLTATHPEGEGAVRGMRLALEDAGISPDEIDYINVHATSTPVGDESEIKAVETVFGADTKANISATKSMTGHLLGGAGAIEAIACVQAVVNDIVPPTINTSQIDEKFNPNFNFTLGKAQKRTVNYALSNTFGFGGHIACSIFKKYKA